LRNQEFAVETVRQKRNKTICHCNQSPM